MYAAIWLVTFWSLVPIGIIASIQGAREEWKEQRKFGAFILLIFALFLAFCGYLSIVNYLTNH